MLCDDVRDWIWEERFPHQEPPAALNAHLAGCPGCAAELEARRATSADLRAQRGYHDADPPEGVDDAVLLAASSAVLAHQSGRFAVDSGPAEVDEAAFDLGPREAAALFAEIDRDLATTGRLRLGDVELQHLRTRAEWGRPRSWSPPRASIAWMVAAACLLIGSLGLGFALGRHSAPAAPTAESLLSPRPRVHSVALGQDAVRGLQEGNTYLLSGPVGGPYRVLGVVDWTDADFVAPLPASDDSEIVVASGPAGGWSRGKQLGVVDLQGPQVEILGRRAVAWH